MVEERKRGKVYLIYTLMFLVMCAAAFYPFYEEGKGFIWGADDFDGPTVTECGPQHND